MTEDTRKRIILWIVCCVGILLTNSGGLLIGLSRGKEEVMVKYTGLMFGGYNIVVGFAMMALSFYILFKIDEAELKAKCGIVEAH